MGSSIKSDRIEWTHPSARALAGGGDPVRQMLEKVKVVTLGAMESGWLGPPFDPFLLADYLSIRVVPRDDIRDARIVPIAGDRFQIEYNPNRPKARIRFSLAHEIAHTILPDCRSQVRDRLARDRMRGDEWQLEMLCNIGAAELLMPIGSLPDLHDVPTIDGLLSLRDKYEVSLEAVLLRVPKLAHRPCCIFAASRNETTPTIDRYHIDYAAASDDWGITVEGGYLLPYESVIGQCTAIGFTAKGDERWDSESDVLHVECVGASPYPGRTSPRVLGVAIPRRQRSSPRDHIEYVRGDACQPRGRGLRIIAHVVNDKTARWGAGFARAVGRKWPSVQSDFLEWSQRHKEAFRLGNTHSIAVEDSLTVFHMIAQHGYGPSDKPRIRYAALETCLERLAAIARDLSASVHIPRIGCGQAGGRWEVVSELLDGILCRAAVKVLVYDLPSSKAPDQRDLQRSLFK